MSILVHKNPNALHWRASDPSALRAALDLAKALLSWPLRVHANRMLLNRMSGMSARELADIGLTPNDVRDTAALPLDSNVGHFLATRADARRQVRPVGQSR